MTRARISPASVALLLGIGGCSGDEPRTGEARCELGAGPAPDFIRRIGCQGDFDLLASNPLDTSIPGARSLKFVLDQVDGDALYFQNSRRYRIHWEFASKHLSGNGKPVVPPLVKFNQTEYYDPGRRFILGSLTYYEGPRAWTLEIAPYDTASATMIAKTYDKVAAVAFFAKSLSFHPTSDAVEREAGRLPGRIPIQTTKALYEKIDYQALNLGGSIGRLRFVSARALEKGEYLSFRDIVVLDHVPNDLSVTLGIITEEFQTPLSHINVLAQTRRIPNMALRNAFANQRLRSLEGRWVELSVGASRYEIVESTPAAADEWWDAHKPGKIAITKMDTSQTGLFDIETIIDSSRPLRDALRAATPAFGGKATHYAAMAQAGIVPMPRPSGFVIPVHYYAQFMEQNGFNEKVDDLMADPSFRDDPKVRDRGLKLLREEMESAPVDRGFERLLEQKLSAGYPMPLRYRSSSTAEDLDGFAGAGLYTSKTGDLADPAKQPLKAIREVWASVWRFRGYEERAYRSIDQRAIGMAVLAHPAFLDEEANGVALTANPFDPTGLQPGFFINVQPGEASVTLPDAGIRTDQFIFYYDLPGQPSVFLERSSLADGKTVLSRRQLLELGKALDVIHRFFMPAYGPPPENPTAWYGLEVDFKFDGEPGQEPALFIKQARPHPGRGN